VNRVRRTAWSLAVIGVLGAIAAPVQAQAQERPIGDIRVFARFDYPGHPGGLVVDGRTLYVDTSNAVFDRPFDGYDEIWAYHLDSGKPVPRQPNPIRVDRALSVQTMGLMGMALDAEGRIYAADMNGRVVRVDPDTGAQDVYATIPTSTYTSFTSMPAFVAFDRDGNLYVGDAAAPVIFRVPPGGGEAQPWFVDPRLAATWGSNVLGLAIDPTGQELYFAAGSQETQIVIYRLPLANPDPAHLEEFHRYDDVVVTPCQLDPGLLATLGCAVGPVFGASGIAFGDSGRLYVAFLSKNQLSILEPDGTEALRFPSPEENMERDMIVNAPFGVAFDGRGSLLVANTGDPTWGNGPDGHEFPIEPTTSDTWVVLDVFVDDTALSLARPVIP
jgi:outer membrane protein assembly factor BamB